MVKIQAIIINTIIVSHLQFLRKLTTHHLVSYNHASWAVKGLARRHYISGSLAKLYLPGLGGGGGGC